MTHSNSLTNLPLKAIICALLFSALPASANEEQLAWQAAQDIGTSDEVYAFISAYPNGAFVNDAKALMIDVLWKEMATPETSPDEPAKPVAVPVTFTTPLTDVPEEIIGQSLEQLIKGRPMFSPVEGLPDSYWQSKECSSCHEWERTNLCEQANTYLTETGSKNLTKKHPYGGRFKANLKNWAIADCK